jgi:2-hydroxychromene-2-carboxylate isomerase
VPALHFFFDFVSPYSYLAWTQIHGFAARNGREVEAIPITLTGLIKANGTRANAEVPRQKAYVIKDTARLAHQYGVPLRPPPVHPFNSLLALRVASLPLPPELRLAVIHALFNAAWVTGEGVTEPEVVARVVQAVGLSPEAVQAAREPEIRDRVYRQTDDALAHDVFSVPTVLADGELFWGCDSLSHLQRYLDGQDPVRPEHVAAWRSPPR